MRLPLLPCLVWRAAGAPALVPIATAAAATLGAILGGLLLAWFNHP
jgi:hypothetical protein